MLLFLDVQKVLEEQLKKILCAVVAIIAIFTATGCKSDDTPGEIPVISWEDTPHGGKVRFAMVSFGGYPLQALTVTDTGVTASIEGCEVEFSGNEQEADPEGQKRNPSASVQSYAEYWALSIERMEGVRLPIPLREQFWYTDHFITNVPFEDMKAAVVAAKATASPGQLICN